MEGKKKGLAKWGSKSLACDIVTRWALTSTAAGRTCMLSDVGSREIIETFKFSYTKSQ